MVPFWSLDARKIRQKLVDDKNIGDNRILVYKAPTQTLVYEEKPAGADHNILSATHLDSLPASVVVGDLIYGNATPRWARLPRGTDGQYLALVAGFPAWTTPPAGAAHNLLSVTHPDTLEAAVARGDLLVGNITPLWARLPIGLSGRYLRSDGLDPAWTQIDHAELINVLADQHHAQLHKDAHLVGGGDAFAVGDLLNAVAKVRVRKNTGAADVGARRRLNLIEGANVTLTIADDPTDEEVDVTIASAGGAGANVKSGQATGGTVTFTTAFSTTPNIVVTPIVASPASSTIYIAFIVTKSTTGFTYKVWSHASLSTFTDITSTMPIEWIATDAGNP